MNDYKGVLVPKSAKTIIRLAGSDPYQAELASLLGEAVETAGAQRTLEEERVDAPMPIRLFTGTKVTGVVGTVPRGLESAVSEALSRLEVRGQKQRIPARVVQSRHGLRVELLMGETR